MLLLSKTKKRIEQRRHLSRARAMPGEGGGIVDFVFGDAAAVFHNSILVLRRPMDNQQNIATAQGRSDAREASCFVLQKCEFKAEAAIRDAARPPIRNYLGRLWRECSRTVDLARPRGGRTRPWRHRLACPRGGRALLRLWRLAALIHGDGGNLSSTSTVP